MPAQDTTANGSKTLFTVGNIDRNTVSLISDDFETIQVPLGVIGSEISIGDCIRIEFARDFTQERTRTCEFESLIGQLIQQYANASEPGRNSPKLEAHVLKVAHNFVLLEFLNENAIPTSINVNGKHHDWITIGPKQLKVLQLLPDISYEIELKSSDGAFCAIKVQTPEIRELASILLFIPETDERISQLAAEVGIQTTYKCDGFVTHAINCNVPETAEELNNLRIPLVPLEWFEQIKVVKEEFQK